MQIIQSVTWNLDVRFPEPFLTMVNALSIFSFDFLSLECVRNDSNHFTSVLLWSITPIVVALFGLVVYVARDFAASKASGRPFSEWRGTEEHSRHVREHTYWFLLLTYVVLPPVSRKQFQALDCMAIAGHDYVRVDTSINCDSSEFQAFKAVNGLFIFIYLSIPVLWGALLWRKRDRLCEMTARAQKARETDSGLRPLRFLYACYEPKFYFMECVEMFR